MMMSNVVTLAAMIRRLEEIRDVVEELPLAEAVNDLWVSVDNLRGQSVCVAELAAYLRSATRTRRRFALIASVGGICHHVVVRCTVSLDGAGWPYWRAVESVTQLRARDLHRARRGEMRSAGIRVLRTEHREIPAPGARLSGAAARCLLTDLRAKTSTRVRKVRQR